MRKTIVISTVAMLVLSALAWAIRSRLLKARPAE